MFTGVVTQQQPQQPSPPERPEETSCEQFIRHCDSLRCPYGLLKSYDGSCERCECEDPCANHECQIDSKCKVDISDHDGDTVFVPVCRKFKKAGQCPRLEQSSTCEVECHDDADCRGEYKCCSAGCSNVCYSPIDERIRATTQAPYHHPEAKESELEEVPEDDLRPVAKEGGVATLRCFATGFPPPSITWKRGGIEVDTLSVLFVMLHRVNIFLFSNSSKPIKDASFFHLTETFKLCNSTVQIPEYMFALLTMALATVLSVRFS